MKRSLSSVLVLLLCGACLDPIRGAADLECTPEVSATACQPPEQRGQARKVTVGTRHACALLETGGVRCWGDAGLVGDGTRAPRPTAVDVRGLGSGVLSVSAGGQHTCAVLEGGTVRCWGDNSRGQLGTGDTQASLEPVEVPGLGANVTSVTAGQSHSCALHAGGQVTCWGANDRLQLGGGTLTHSTRAVLVEGLPANLTALTAGATHTCASTAAGEAWCWGSNTSGELGDGQSGVDRSSGPVRVDGLPGPSRALATGGGHTCARVGDGEVACWGSNATGALGDDTALDSVSPVRPVGLASGVRQVRAGWAFTCAVVADGDVRCWGQNQSGQLGDGTRLHRAAPVRVAGLPEEAEDVAAGMTSACAVLRDGRVWCWGGNAQGQLGDGTQMDRVAPVAVEGLDAP
ncbi:chromosome condensation regulator RCC1 [Pyxidicoccus fallax]|uniref:Chromosome condensation regulator RCC1 n=1 Tax=Pyxidicoccus fallax TaxID=394095 RepID=A0A848LKJ4_9BACT|nr:chromosome condensation regulator RCC1 [Pyxidicoccus fallax]NMO18212.1 chromosome condensation regulator RCC1 [Pyxidicoccus fallax]NPC84814.1 chromosome condensation regulator RCC1 [Pyxidicoccus fallax]